MVSTMRGTNFDQRGMFGEKPRIHPALLKEQELEHEPTEEPLEELPEEISTEEVPTEEVITEEPTPEDSEDKSSEETYTGQVSSTMTEIFECPKCNAEFGSKRSLNGHMLRYTRKKKEMFEL